MQNAEDLIKALKLTRHPEGGWYRRTWCDADRSAGGRAHSSAIYYLLEAEQSSRWHCVDAAEIWAFHAGSPLVLRLWDGDAVETAVVGLDLAAGAQPQRIVPANIWQSATATAGWALVSCIVAPEFRFDSWQLARAGWQPGDGPPCGD